MPTYNFQLLDFPGNYEKGTLPHGPRAYIALKTHSTVTWCDKVSNKEFDFTVVTPECVTVAEFRHHIKRLMKELETIDKQAEKFFGRDAEMRMAKSSKKT